MKTSMCLFFLFAAVAQAALQLAIEGKVISMEADFVTIQHENTLVRVPKQTLNRPTVRPGEWVTVTVDSHTDVTTSKAPTSPSKK